MPLFVNEYEIEELLRTFRQDETPNLLAGAEALDRLCQWTNANSDGWPYWSKPTTAAKKLMALLMAADRFDPQDCTDAELRAALTPIKAFLTKQGVDHQALLSPPPPSVKPDWHDTLNVIETMLSNMSGDDRNDAIEALRSRFDEIYDRNT